MNRRTAQWVTAAALVSAVTVSACGRGRGVRVPCENIRSLRRGMSERDVIAALGQPVSRIIEDHSQDSVRRTVDVVLEYSHPDSYDNVQLRAEFSHGKLVYVVSYRRSWVRDRIEDLYEMNTDGISHEGPEFARWLCSR